VTGIEARVDRKVILKILPMLMLGKRGVE
jgi:hypothetical protein